MRENQLSRYGAIAKSMPWATGKIFFLLSATETQFGDFQNRFPVDEDGVPRVYTSWTAVLAACTSAAGDSIYVSPSFVTGMTAAEMLSAETKGVRVYLSGNIADGTHVSRRATAALPQSVKAPLFTVTGRIKLLAIIGEVTTVIQTQANNTKIVATPTVGAAVDLCAVLDITAKTVGTDFFITGTLATAMQSSASAVGLMQASPLLVPAGTIDLSCAASSTGAVKWMINYIPLDPGAKVIPA